MHFAYAQSPCFTRPYRSRWSSVASDLMVTTKLHKTLKCCGVTLLVAVAAAARLRCNTKILQSTSAPVHNGTVCRSSTSQLLFLFSDTVSNCNRQTMVLRDTRNQTMSQLARHAQVRGNWIRPPTVIKQWCFAIFETRQCHNSTPVKRACAGKRVDLGTQRMDGTSCKSDADWIRC